MLSFLRYNTLAVSWSLIILLLCLTPTHHLPQFDIWAIFSLDKVAHFLLFSVLALFTIVGLKRQYYSYHLRYYAKTVALLYCAAYGFLTESLQLLISPTRSFDWLDLVADIIGAIIGIGLFRFIYGKEFFN